MNRFTAVRGSGVAVTSLVLALFSPSAISGAEQACQSLVASVDEASLQYPDSALLSNLKAKSALEACREAVNVDRSKENLYKYGRALVNVKNIDAAAEVLIESAESGYVPAQVLVGWLAEKQLLKLSDIPGDFADLDVSEILNLYAIHWYLRASESDHEVAQKKLLLMHKMGLYTTEINYGMDSISTHYQVALVHHYLDSYEASKNFDSVMLAADVANASGFYSKLGVTHGRDEPIPEDEIGQYGELLAARIEVIVATDDPQQFIYPIKRSERLLDSKFSSIRKEAREIYDHSQRQFNNMQVNSSDARIWLGLLAVGAVILASIDTGEASNDTIEDYSYEGFKIGLDEADAWVP